LEGPPVPTSDPKKKDDPSPGSDEDDDNGGDLARLFRNIEDETDEERRSAD